MSAILPFTSCDKEDEPIADITGNWSGESRYYNPASGTKSQYLSIEFFKDGTGELSYEAPTSSSIAYFTYNVTFVNDNKMVWTNSTLDKWGEKWTFQRI